MQIALSTPILYHDPSKEFLGMFFPPQVNLSEMERQRRIGELTNILMSKLPPEQRKAYLLQPKQFLTLQSMVEAILQADGITREMMEAQQERLNLLQRLIQAASDEQKLRAVVAENDEKLDQDFFDIMAAVVENAAAQGDERLARQLSALFNIVLGMSSLGRKIQAQQEILAGLGENTTREEILERLLKAEEDSAIEALVAVARPLMDYQFLLLFSERIEQAEKRKDRAEVLRLRALRDRVLELQRQQDEIARAIVQGASQLLQAVLASNDPATVLRARKAEINEAFLAILANNIQAAEQRGATVAARRLREVWETALEILDEDLPSDLRLINRLLRAEYPEGSRRILTEHRSELDQELVESMQAMADAMRAQGQEEMAKRLENIRTQAMLLL